MAHEPNAILAISSTDRYIRNVAGNVNQPESNFIAAEYLGEGPYANDFSIVAPGALINGYIEKIIVSQIQIQYNIPTISAGRNNFMAVLIETGTGTAQYTIRQFELPYGFFTPAELAAMLQSFLNAQLSGFTVSYSQGATQAVSNIGFTVSLNNAGRRFSFPTPVDAAARGLNPNVIPILLKTYRLFGFNVNNSNPQVEQYSWFNPNFLYTPYIDFYSDALTNYQKIKDSDSSTAKRKGLVSRVYLSGAGNPQYTTDVITVVSQPEDDEGNPGAIISVSKATNSLGCEPFIMTADLNNPKVIKWTPDTAVNSLDFQLRDCYGDLIFTIIPPGLPGGGEVFNTEWQMTLLCVESD